jgi:hypothetical protein
VIAYEKKRENAQVALAGKKEQEDPRKTPPPEDKKNGLEAILDKGDGKQPAGPTGPKGKEPVKPAEPAKDPKKKDVLDE